MNKLVATTFLLMLYLTSSSTASSLVEDDFYWDKTTSPYKEQIITMVNKIAKENSACTNIDPGSVAKSSKGTPENPVFFVTCMATIPFNVWFSPNDVDKEMSAATAIVKDDAILACRAAAQSKTSQPNSVDFSILHADYSTRGDGRASLESTYTAKNEFNTTSSYKIYCLFDGRKLIESTATELR